MPKPVPFIWAARLGAVVLGGFVAWVAYAVFGLGVGLSLIAGLMVGVLDFLLLKFLFSQASKPKDDHNNRIG